MRVTRQTSHRRQRGAVAVIAAVAALTMLIATLLAIEVGRMYFAHRHLQKLANLAAIDTARLMSGCNGLALPTQAELDAEAAASLARNGGTALVTSTTVEPGDIVTDQGLGGTGVVRYLSPVDPTDTAEMTDAHGVRVTLEGPFPSLLVPLMQRAGSTMRVSATAEQAALGSFWIGSGLLSLDGGILNTLLGGLFGGSISLTLVDYQGLASVQVSAADLMTAINLDSTDLSDIASLSTQTPLLSDTVNGLMTQFSGQVSGSVAGALQAAAGSSSQTVPLGDIIGNVDPSAVDVPFVNLADLLIQLGAAAQANASGGPTPIKLTPAVSIPGVATLGAYVQILEPAQFSGLGRAGSLEASTAQVRVMVRIQVTAVSSITNALSALIGSLVTVSVSPLNLGLDVEVAKATGYLDELDCPSVGTNDGYPIARLSAATQLATVKMGAFTGSASASTPPNLVPGSILTVTLAGKGLLAILGNSTLGVAIDPVFETTAGSATTQPLPLDVTDFTRLDLPDYSPPTWLADGIPPEAPVADNPQTVSSGNLLSTAVNSLLSSLNSITPTQTGGGLLGALGDLLGPTLSTLISTVVTLLTPILSGATSIVDALIDPLLQALGIKLGTGTVIMNTVTVNQPQVVSTALPPTAP